jgi:hypothetical protein
MIVYLSMGKRTPRERLGSKGRSRAPAPRTHRSGKKRTVVTTGCGETFAPLLAHDA